MQGVVESLAYTKITSDNLFVPHNTGTVSEINFSLQSPKCKLHFH
jgi:hypothetical protein